MDKLARTPNTIVISCEMASFPVRIWFCSSDCFFRISSQSLSSIGETIPDSILSLDYLIARMWDELNLVKVYTKKRYVLIEAPLQVYSPYLINTRRGAHPDLSDPICLRKGATIEVKLIHPFKSLGLTCLGCLQRCSSKSGTQLSIWACLVSFNLISIFDNPLLNHSTG
jgi:hypothetical protein